MNKPQPAAAPSRPPGPRVTPRAASQLTGIDEFRIFSYAQRGMIRSEWIRGLLHVDLDDCDRID